MNMRRNTSSSRWACTISGSIRRLGLPDTEGGLYLASRDLARIGQLFLQGGLWEGKQIVSPDWINESVAPAISTGDGGWKYGFQWWLVPYGKSGDKLAWAAHGFGGQQLIVVPEYDLIAVFTGWDILPSSEKHKHDQLERILAAVDKQYRCASAADRGLRIERAFTDVMATGR